MIGRGFDGFFEQFPTLQTGNITLRETTLSDAQSIYTLFSDPVVVAYYDIAPLKSVQQAEEMIGRWANRFTDHKGVRWGITLAGSKQVVGTIGLYFHHEWRAALGYDLAQAHWRQGIMSAALTEVIRVVFDRTGLNRLEALVMPGNVASEYLLEKLGFVREGLLREYMYFKEEHQDLISFSLLRSDYES